MILQYCKHVGVLTKNKATATNFYVTGLQTETKWLHFATFFLAGATLFS